MQDNAVKAYGLAYKNLNDISGQYAVKSQMYLTNIIESLKQAGNQAYKANNEFPVKFYEQMSGILIKWFWNGFENTPKEQIFRIFQEMWKFHKTFLSRDAMTDADWKMVCDSTVGLAEAFRDAEGHVTGEKPKYVRYFYVAILDDLEEVFKNKGE